MDDEQKFRQKIFWQYEWYLSEGDYSQAVQFLNDWKRDYPDIVCELIDELPDRLKTRLGLQETSNTN